jgi:hypothetical protein
MATIDYHFGLLNLDKDLTDPKSTSEPVALIGTGYEPSTKAWHVFYLVPAKVEERRSIASDPIAASILQRLPEVLKERVDAARAAGVPPENLLPWLSTQLERVNLNFAWIKELTKQLPSAAHSAVVAAPIKEFSRFLVVSTPRRRGAKKAVKRDRPPAQYSWEPLFRRRRAKVHSGIATNH